MPIRAYGPLGISLNREVNSLPGETGIGPVSGVHLTPIRDARETLDVFSNRRTGLAR